MDIERNIRNVEHRIAGACERSGRSPEEVTLVAVTKTVEPPAIEAAFNAGIRNFGENRVQEAINKLEQLKNIRASITWHMVGHIQTNKAKTALAIFDIIHSIDSLRLARILNEHCETNLPVLIEVNVAAETTKNGFLLHEVDEAVREIRSLPKLEIEGLMTVAPLASDAKEVRPVFRRLRHLGKALGLKHLSMGMTDDFEVAIEEGATMVRIGRLIFGERKTP